MGNDDEVKGGSKPARSSAAGKRSGSRSSAGRSSSRSSQTTRTRRRPPEENASRSRSRNSGDGGPLSPGSRSMFLRDVERQLARPELYDLGVEFAKTRRNRSRVVGASVALFVVVMVGASIAVTSYIQNRSQNVPVNISAFKDVNLMELLDRAKEISNKITAANRNLQELTSSMQNAVSTVQQNSAAEVQLVDNQLIPSTQRQSRIASIRRQAKSRIQEIEARYAVPIKKQKAKIANLQAQASQYDTRQMKEAKKQQAILNSQQSVFDAQMKETEDYYRKRIAGVRKQYRSEIASINKHNTQLFDLMKQNEATTISHLVARYNPTFTSPSLKALIAQPVSADGPVSPPTPRERALLSTLEQSGSVQPARVSDLERRIADFATLMAALRAIPFKNSVPSTLSHVAFFNHRIITDFRAIGNGMDALLLQRDHEVKQLEREMAQNKRVIAAKDEKIGEYEHALRSLVSTNRENGYILDARNPAKIAVFVDPLYHVKNGETAYVFRHDDQRIGTIRFAVSNGTVTARELTLAKKNVPMEPFDKILLKLK